jgi:DNA adenine methylase
MLRYPGGKLRLMKKIDLMIKNTYPEARTSEWTVAEPFVGGGGSLINMAKDFPLWKFHLNDANKDVGSFWKFFKASKNSEFEALYKAITTQVVNLETYKNIFHSEPTTNLEKTFKVIFLNKTSYNGFITESLPIGGWDQKSAWNVDVYWNPPNIIRKIERTRMLLKDKILSVSCEDFETFLNNVPFDFIYADPPYIKYGKKWYNCDFGLKDLERLRDFLNTKKAWCLSIDRLSATESLFNGNNLQGIDIIYSAKSSNKSKKEDRSIPVSNEMVIFP